MIKCHCGSTKNLKNIGYVKTEDGSLKATWKCTDCIKKAYKDAKRCQK